MAMFPSLLNDDLFRDLFDDPFFTAAPAAALPAAPSSTALMSADVRETDKAYDVDLDMPGFKKDDINVELQNGYLTVSAHRDSSHDEKDKEGKWLRRERYAGSVSRSFYVGDNVKESDIKASYKDGTLCLQIPKPTEKPAVEAKHTIAIEG